MVRRIAVHHSVVHECCAKSKLAACCHNICGANRQLQFRCLDSTTLGAEIKSATAFTSVCINTAIYLPWLVSQCLKNGVSFQRRYFSHIGEAFRSVNSASRADIVVNCTGLGATTLGGVQDKTVIPARGQIVLVSNDAGGRMIDFSGTDDGDDEACYIMSRAAGGGTVLGGSYQKGNSNPQVDQNLAIRIMKRAVAACPELTKGSGKIEDLDVIRHSVGLRPVRNGGARIEKERFDKGWVVHNYGHGGAGYQSSYGCASAAVKLVESIATPSAKL
jgi:D-amino-acid oxidase